MVAPVKFTKMNIFGVVSWLSLATLVPTAVSVESYVNKGPSYYPFQEASESNKICLHRNKEAKMVTLEWTGDSSEAGKNVVELEGSMFGLFDDLAKDKGSSVSVIEDSFQLPTVCSRENVEKLGSFTTIRNFDEQLPTAAQEAADLILCANFLDWEPLDLLLKFHKFFEDSRYCYDEDSKSSFQNLPAGHEQISNDELFDCLPPGVRDPILIDSIFVQNKIGILRSFIRDYQNLLARVISLSSPEKHTFDCIRLSDDDLTAFLEALASSGKNARVNIYDLQMVRYLSDEGELKKLFKNAEIDHLHFNLLIKLNDEDGFAKFIRKFDGRIKTRIIGLDNDTLKYFLNDNLVYKLFQIFEPSKVYLRGVGEDFESLVTRLFHFLPTEKSPVVQFSHLPSLKFMKGGSLLLKSVDIEWWISFSDLSKEYYEYLEQALKENALEIRNVKFFISSEFFVFSGFSVKWSLISKWNIENLEIRSNKDLGEFGNFVRSLPQDTSMNFTNIKFHGASLIQFVKLVGNSKFNCSRYFGLELDSSDDMEKNKEFILEGFDWQKVKEFSLKQRRNQTHKEFYGAMKKLFGLIYNKLSPDFKLRIKNSDKLTYDLNYYDIKYAEEQGLDYDDKCFKK